MQRQRLKLRRREFLKVCAAATAGAVAPVGGFFDAAKVLATSHPTDGKLTGSNAAQFVRPEIGTGWRGHMFPGPVAPFGLVQLSPDTAGGPEPQWNAKGDYTGWEHCSGYYNPDNTIMGFSHTHLQGTGGSDLGDILIMPLVEGRNWSWETGVPENTALMQIQELGQNSGWVFDKTVPGYRSFFSHDRESGHAGFYSVHLDTPDVQAELTATTRCGMHRYIYPQLPPSTRQGVILDLEHGLGGKPYHAELHIESATRASGVRATHGWAEDRQIYFVIEFSQPVASATVRVDGGPESMVGDLDTSGLNTQFSGQDVKAIFAHAASADPLVIRVGISPTSVEGAAKNLAAEIPHWDFDRVTHEAETEWNKALGVLDADLPTRALTEAFYTDTYRGLVAPATFNDVDGTYRGQDRKNHSNPGFTKYTTLSIWDIYRGQVPFIMLTQPHRTSDIVRTMIADYDQLGLHTLPMWPLWGNETWSMTGFHAAGIILGAYTRGFRDFDLEAAYAAIRDTALSARDTAPADASSNNIERSRDNAKLQAEFREHGFVPMNLHRGSVSQTLDLAYDYWCAGAMAELIGKPDDAALFYKLSQNYKNIFDPSTGFMRPKTADGKWRDPFRPDIEYEDYVETDAWQASFSVPHDVQGLIDLHGGDAGFIAKLDGLFTAPSYVAGPPWPQPDITGMVGQDAQGNEPSNHNPYLYPFAGAAWKTQYWVRKVAALYNNTPAGIPGNDDCGQLASWFVFAALGFYPVNAATGVYIVGSPIVDRAAIRNPGNGTTFEIIAENNSPENLYIQSAQMNPKEWTRSWLTHAQIVAGGELRFRMGAKPNKDWASAPADRPPSGLVKV
jgi:predicted alpha-1,2-mannosidase